MCSVTVISNLKVLREMGGISLESLLEKSPYTTDVVTEMERLAKDKGNIVEDKGDSQQE